VCENRSTKLEREEEEDGARIRTYPEPRASKQSTKLTVRNRLNLKPIEIDTNLKVNPLTQLSLTDESAFAARELEATAPAKNDPQLYVNS